MYAASATTTSSLLGGEVVQRDPRVREHGGHVERPAVERDLVHGRRDEVDERARPGGGGEPHHGAGRERRRPGRQVERDLVRLGPDDGGALARLGSGEVLSRHADSLGRGRQQLAPAGGRVGRCSIIACTGEPGRARDAAGLGSSRACHLRRHRGRRGPQRAHRRRVPGPRGPERPGARAGASTWAARPGPSGSSPGSTRTCRATPTSSRCCRGGCAASSGCRSSCAGAGISSYTPVPATRPAACSWTRRTTRRPPRRSPSSGRPATSRRGARSARAPARSPRGSSRR